MTTDATQIEGLLRFITADSYQNWIQVGMGLKSEFGDDGLPFWDRWSQSSDKYKASEIPRKWASFCNVGIGFGTVIYLAKEHGFTGQISHPCASQPPRNRVRRIGFKSEELHDEANRAWISNWLTSLPSLAAIQCSAVQCCAAPRLLRCAVGCLVGRMLTL